MDADDCSVIISSLSLLFLDVKDRFALSDDLIPQDIEADDMIPIYHSLICLMKNKSLQASKLKHFVVLELSKLRKEPLFATVIPEGMRQNDLEITLKKIGEVIKNCLTIEKTIGSCDNNVKKIKEKVYKYKERSNTFPLYSFGTSQQGWSDSVQSTTEKTIPESEAETQHAVETRSSELENTDCNSKQGVNKPQFHNNCTSSIPIQFSMSPVPEQMEIDDSRGNCCSKSEVTASTSTKGNSVSKSDIHSASQKFTISTNLVNKETGCLDELDNNEPESTTGSSSSHSSVALVGNKAYDDIPGATYTALPHCVAKCSGGLIKISKTVTPKHSLSRSPEEQNCCKKKCLQNISENIWKECQNFTRKQKENYVKENVEIFPNKTAKTTNRERNRGFYRIYSLSDDTVVCKTAFCKVLGGVCSDFINRNIDRTQTENTRVSHKIQFTHHKGTTEAHTECMDLPNARSNSDTENFVAENLKSQPEASPRVNLTQSVHVEQSDQIINTGMLSRGEQQRLLPNVLNQNDQANKHEKNIQDDMELNYNANQNSHDLQPEQADDSSQQVRPTNPGSKWKSRMLASESESTLNRNTPSTSNYSMVVEQLPRLSNVSGNLSIGKDSKNSENIDGRKYQNNDTTTCDKSCSSIYSSSKNGSVNVEEALCSGLAQSPTEEETEDPKGMNPFLLNDTMNSPICEHDDNQTDEDVLSESGRSNPTSLHGQSSDDENQPATNSECSLSSKKDQQCCKKFCLKNVPQQVKDKCKIEFVQTYVIRLPTKTTNTNRQRNRRFHHTYKLDDGRVVCKSAFCKILGVSSDFIRTIQTENISQARTHPSDLQNTNKETESIRPVYVDTQPSVSILQTRADTQTVHVDTQPDQTYNRSNITCSTAKCSQEIGSQHILHVRRPSDNKEAENISDNVYDNNQPAVPNTSASQNIELSQPVSASTSAFSVSGTGSIRNSDHCVYLPVLDTTSTNLKIHCEQSVLTDSSYNTNIKRFEHQASMHTSPVFNVNQDHASNTSFTHNLAQSLANKMPSSYSVIQNISRNTPSSVVQSLTSNTPSSVFECLTSNMPSSVFQSLTSNMPSSVFQSLTSNMPSSVFQNISRNTPSSMFQSLTSNTSSSVVQSLTSNTPSSVFPSLTSNTPSSVFECLTSNTPSSVFQSLTSNTPSSVFQSLTSNTPSSVFQSLTSNTPSSVFQSLNSNVSSSHSVFQNVANNTLPSIRVIQSNTDMMVCQIFIFLSPFINEITIPLYL